MRTVLRPELVLTGSMAGNLTSAVTVLQGLSKVSYEVDWSGTAPVGTVGVQVSNSYSLNPNGTVHNAGTWTTITNSAVSGNTGSGVIDATTGAYAVRLIYTAGSGTGTLTATVAGKVA